MMSRPNLTARIADKSTSQLTSIVRGELQASGAAGAARAVAALAELERRTSAAESNAHRLATELGTAQSELAKQREQVASGTLAQWLVSAVQDKLRAQVPDCFAGDWQDPDVLLGVLHVVCERAAPNALGSALLVQISKEISSAGIQLDPIGAHADSKDPAVLLQVRELIGRYVAARSVRGIFGEHVLNGNAGTAQKK
jgi:hypothetical protein